MFSPYLYLFLVILLLYYYHTELIVTRIIKIKFFGLGKPFAILQISRLVLFAIILSMIVGEGAKIKQL